MLWKPPFYCMPLWSITGIFKRVWTAVAFALPCRAVILFWCIKVLWLNWAENLPVLVAMTVLPAPRPRCVLEHLVVEVNENKSQNWKWRWIHKQFLFLLVHLLGNVLLWATGAQCHLCPWVQFFVPTESMSWGCGPRCHHTSISCLSDRCSRSGP